ncbi:MAG TPA: hypothetical protein VH328_00175, partial [Burkholderiaceae bacterium]|nr:hypothetical protein [Burkholderiaceae bacterium]
MAPSLRPVFLLRPVLLPLPAQRVPLPLVLPGLLPAWLPALLHRHLLLPWPASASAPGLPRRRRDRGRLPRHA